MLLERAGILSQPQVETRERGIKVVTVPPLLDYVESAVWQDQDGVRLSQMLQASHALDSAFLAWEMNRKGVTPIGHHNTGFEGYLIARVGSFEEAHEYFLTMGQSILDSIARAHKNSYKTRDLLEKAIHGEKVPAAIIEEWMAIFGAQLARERAHLLANPKALQYRDEVRRRAIVMPKIRYVVGSDGQLVQEYFVEAEKISSVPTFHMDDNFELPFTIVKNIGMFGHPLLRSATRCKYS
ncbi:MAG: hypothetical protein H6773_00920 [Pseudomonadales bacterium]|nr:hypothetical protein [Candidatus Woesebacteria bacterium]MCB9800719.1 hypothetical protein [Pseudomonadales bacterium]